MLKKQIPFYIFVIAVMIGLTVPVLIQDGMFMDAVLYTSVAHNQSEGFGTFWHPQFSKYNVYGQNAFFEQPPLGLWIMSIPFRIFGDSMYIERGYTFLMMLITAFLIIIFWKKINKSGEFKNLAWLPVLFWITIPEVFWSFSNNMLENTMGVFILAAAILIYDALSPQKTNIVKLIFGAILIFCATMIKGIPALFVISIPGLLWLTTAKIGFMKAVFTTIAITLVIALIYTLLLLNPVAQTSLKSYFFDRALYRIGENPTVDSRFYILGSLFQQLAGQIIFCIIIFIAGKIIRPRKLHRDELRTALFFICIGIAGSLPLMFTLVQKAFYYVPSLPFFAIGFSILVAPAIQTITNKIIDSTIKMRISYIFSISFLIATIWISVSKTGSASRNTDILNDVHSIGAVMPDHECVTIPKSMWNNWQLQVYLMRNYSICLDPGSDHEYYLTYSESTPANEKYSKLIIRGKQFDLYEAQ